VGEIGYRLDTTDLLPNTLRNWIKEWLDIRTETDDAPVRVFQLQARRSLDADLVVRRALSAQPALRPAAASAHRPRPRTWSRFSRGSPRSAPCWGTIRRFVETWLPAYGQDSRSSLTVAVGCTGGRHRSVYLVERLGAHFRSLTPVLVRHRHLVPAA